MYKIAVYAICKDEIQNIDKGMKSMWEADYICVLDTGSADYTYEVLLDYQKRFPSKIFIDQKIITPGRFDRARNESMKLIPKDADICICTDFDEILTSSGANKLKAAWYEGCQRGSYLYAWSHKENGDPAMVFGYDKIHDNSGEWSGKYPVHEYLVRYEPATKWCSLPEDFVALHHYPLLKEDRKNYLPLLELRAQEDPTDYYGLVYLAHQYYYSGMYQKCADFILKEVLPKLLPSGVDEMECIPDLYLFLGNCYRALNNNIEAERYYRKGIAHKKTYRENYIQLGDLFLQQNRFEDCINIINEGLLYSRREYTGLETSEAWGSKPGDLLCLAYWNLGAKHMSLVCAETALRFDPTNKRLQDNVKLLQDGLIN